MKPHEQRVVDEKADLDGRIGRLNGFFGSQPFDFLTPAEQGRLRKQAVLMQELSVLLGERIANFPKS